MAARQSLKLILLSSLAALGLLVCVCSCVRFAVRQKQLVQLEGYAQAYLLL